MKKQTQFSIRIALLSAVFSVGFFAFTHSAFALDRPLIYSPKDNSNLLDQPLRIVGVVPVNTVVRITLNGKVLTRVIVPAPKVKKGKKVPATTTFTYNYPKILGTGKYTLTYQTIKGLEVSDVSIGTITVPAQWRRKVDGMLVPTKVWNQLPFGVMIENTPDSRPQAGLSQAAIVYETLAEGGVTRFLAIYPQATKPKLLGPVRSSRPYYVDWAKEHDAIYLHAGGSRDALDEIGRLKVRSYDGLTRNAAKYMSRKCIGVHCLFMSNLQLDRLVKDKKLTTVVAKSDVGWVFKNDALLKDRPKSASSKKLSIDFNGRTYRVDWTYDRATNRYKRYNGGVMAKDRNTGKQIRAANVLVQRIPKEKVLDRKLRLEFKLIGRGDATLYRDGKAIALRWWKKDKNSKTVFFLKGTQTPVEFNRGTTWVEVVPGTRSVTYK